MQWGNVLLRDKLACNMTWQTASVVTAANHDLDSRYDKYQSGLATFSLTD